jgi:hypothetical protein
MKIKFKFSIMLLVFGLLFSACHEDEPKEDNPVEEEVVQPIQVEGNVYIPAGIPSENIGTLEIVSGFYSNPVISAMSKATSKLKSATANSQYACKVTTYPNSVQLHTILNNGNPFMFGLTIGIGIDTGAHLDFNEESTAISLIFMNPLFTVSDPATATTVVAKIKNASSFNLLKAEIHNLMYQGSLNYMTPDIKIENLRYYNKVIYETLLSLNENYQIQQNGLQVIENTRAGNEIQFKIRNRLKRYSTIYAYKYKDGQLSKTDIKFKNSNLGYGPFEWIDCGSYDWIECWMQIFTLNLEDQITEESDIFAVNVDNAEKIYLKCYGLGIADGNFLTIDSEAYLGGALAMAKTAVFDIVKPTVEVVTGIKKFPKAGDLRGRDNDDPLYKLVMNYYEKLFMSSGTYTKFLKATNSALSSGNAKKEVMKTFWSVTKSFLIDEKNVELYIEILKKYATLSVAEKAVLNKTFTTVFQMKAAADIAENALNLSEALYATLLATNWVTEFRINVDGTTDNQLEPLLPVVRTHEVTEIGNDFALIGATPEHSSVSSLIEYGVYYSTHSNPVINGIKITEQPSYGFGTMIRNLTPSTKYYVQAYATNEHGTGYGDIVEFTTLEDDTPPPITDGVTINGVTWATRNVDAPGTFAATPESAGMFYQWNRKVGWSSTDPMVASNGNTTWDGSIPSGAEWETVNDPCPEGWRVPTHSEQNLLVRAGYSWTTQNGVTGGVFGTVPYQIFLSASSYRGSEGLLDPPASGSSDLTGRYWASTKNYDDYSWCFYFYKDWLYDASDPTNGANCVRCVKK